MHALYLEPETGVTIVSGEVCATSLPVWLRLQPSGAIKSGSWVRMRYRSSYFDENVRPLIRFTGGDSESTIQPMNGTLFGVGEWVGYVPEHTSTISISPVTRLGLFNFQVDSIEAISPIELVRRGLAANPLAVIWSMQAWWFGANTAARRGLKFSGSSSALTDYDAWHRSRSRAADLAGLDRLRADWDKTPTFRIFMTIGGGALNCLQATIQSIQAQIYRRWSLQCLIDSRCAPGYQQAVLTILGDDVRISTVENAVKLSTVVDDFSVDDLCAVMCPGDTLPHYALALLAEVYCALPASARLLWR